MDTTLVRRSSGWSLPAPALLVLFFSLLLTALGLAILFSATQGMHSDPHFLLKRQLMWLSIALFAGTIAAFINWEAMRRFVPLVAFGIMTGLVLVLIPAIGVEVNGARRWLDLGGGVRLQVSEFAKIGMVLVLAHYLGCYQREIQTFRWGFLLPFAGLGVVCFLIMLQPDFGTALLCGVVGGMLLFLAGTRWLYLIPSALLALSAFAVAVWQDPVRFRRLTAFIDIEGNRHDGSYQLFQGMLAFVSGGLSGVGLGNGRQQMAYLPEAHTDFIFSIVGEELGFIFTGGTVLLYIAIFMIGYLQLRKAPNLFQFALVSGALLFLALQALINLTVVTGLAPTKGMSLPFISYGGSNLVVMFIFIGIIISAFRNWEKPTKRKARVI